MTPVESAINLGLMCNEEGVQFIYDLANSKASQELKTIVLKNIVEGYLFDIVEGADDANTDSNEFLDNDFLNILFSGILRSINWDVIVNYHKEHKGLDTR